MERWKFEDLYTIHSMPLSDPPFESPELFGSEAKNHANDRQELRLLVMVSIVVPRDALKQTHPLILAFKKFEDHCLQVLRIWFWHPASIK